MALDAVLLSRLQFFWVIALAHPAAGIHRRAGRPTSRCSRACICRPGARSTCGCPMFWLKMFAVSFGMGVVSGIVMPFQFGTNWSRFSDATADVIRPAAGLRRPDGVLPRGGVPRRAAVRRARWCRPGRTFVAALMVAVGTLFSSFWILAAEQLDADADRLSNRRRPLLARGLVRDHLQSILPVPPRAHRRSHSIITTALRRASASPRYHLRAGRFRARKARRMTMACGLLTVLVPLQIVARRLRTASIRASISRRSWRRSKPTGKRKPHAVAAVRLAGRARREPIAFEVAVPVLGRSS